jgi:trehalose/maltose hydrolase-like predicted phosphorylase
MLLLEHVQQWASEWQQGSVRVSGNQRLSRAINSSLYYLMSSSSPDLPLSLSPGGLASNGIVHSQASNGLFHPSPTGYNGHTFWDCESWMFPPLLALQPKTALQLLQFVSRDTSYLSLC